MSGEGSRLVGLLTLIVLTKMNYIHKPKFVVYKDKVGYNRWRLVAGNGEIVAASEAYASKQGAINSANRVRQIAHDATIVDSTN